MIDYETLRAERAAIWAKLGVSSHDNALLALDVLEASTVRVRDGITPQEKTTLVLAAENVARCQRAVAEVVPHAGNVWSLEKVNENLTTAIRLFSKVVDAEATLADVRRNLVIASTASDDDIPF